MRPEYAPDSRPARHQKDRRDFAERLLLRSPPMPTDIGPVDWNALVADLAALLGSVDEICRRTGVARSCLRDWALGRSEPRFSNGEAVLVLWMESTGRGRSEAPRRPAPTRARESLSEPA